MHDLIREYGYLTLGTRLKRLGERLQSDVTRIAKEVGLPVPAGLFPLLAALDGRARVTITDLVATLGVSQPGVTRGVARLASLGLVSVTRAHRDQRQKSVALTAEGKALLKHARNHMWPVVERAVRGLCEGPDAPFLTQLERVEDGLAHDSLDARARALSARKHGR